jgi:hypothetical protein
MNNIISAILIGLAAILVIALLAVAGGTILYFLWPYVMVEVFKLPVLTWWQAVCLVWITHMLIPTNSNTSTKV